MDELAPGVWETNQDLAVGGLLHMDHRMTVLRLPGDEGRLLVHSPISYSEALRQELAALGEPAYFVAPSYFHDMYWKEWLERYPQATFLAPPGMPVRGSWDALAASDIWSDDLFPLEIRGMPWVQEHLLYHRPSGSIIVADLVFNMPAGKSAVNRMFEKMAGIYDRFATSRLFQTFIREKEAFGESLSQVLELDFERIIMGHGKVQALEAKNMLKRVYNRYLPF